MEFVVCEFYYDGIKFVFVVKWNNLDDLFRGLNFLDSICVEVIMIEGKKSYFGF